MFKTVYRKLTDRQKENGVTYSVALLLEGQTEKEHVKEFNPKTDKPEKLELLKDTSFFKNMANQYAWNVTKIVRQ